MHVVQLSGAFPALPYLFGQQLFGEQYLGGTCGNGEGYNKKAASHGLLTS
jgi:hypothetical protein